jgi:hypothetical protein
MFGLAGGAGIGTGNITLAEYVCRPNDKRAIGESLMALLFYPQ